MTQYTDATRKKVVRQHIQDGRTLKSLAAEYGVSVTSEIKTSETSNP